MPGNRVAIIIPNSNTPDLVKQLTNHIDCYTKYPHDGILVNNPSDISWDGQYTLNTSSRLEMTGAVLLGLLYADILEQITQEKYFAYWIITTSCQFLDMKDYLTPMTHWLENNFRVAMISPSIDGTAWDGLHSGGSGVKKVWGVDNNAVLIRSDWFNSIGRYDKRLVIGWGPALETCWMARRDKMSICVHQDLHMKKYDGIAEKLGLRSMSREERNSQGSKEMNTIFTEKYGSDFINKLRNEYWSR